MRINNNMMAMNTHRQLGVANNSGAKSMEKLSSGMRINRAGDDAAGLAISEKMRGQIRGLNQASANSQDGISMIQTAEGALNETHAILQRMRELAVQSANDTNVGVDRSEIQKEMDELSKEVTRIANNTEFNTQKLTNGGIGKDGLGEVKFHIGANEGQDVALSINAMDAKSLGVARDVQTAELDPTNAAGVSSAKVDSVDVEKTLAAGEYKVTVADVSGTVTKATGATVTVGENVLTGTASVDTTVELTYKAPVIGTGVVGASNVADPLVTNAATALGTITNTAVTDADAGEYTLEFTSKTAYKILKDGVDTLKVGTVNTANTQITGASFTVALEAAGDYAAGDTMSFTLTAHKAAGWEATGDLTGAVAGAVNAVNGLNIDATKLVGGTAGDKVTIEATKGGSQTVQLSDSTGVTPIGNAIIIDKAKGGTYTVGNNAGAGQAKVSFKAGEATAGSSTITVGTNEATAAAKQADNTMSDATNAGGINVSTQDTASKAITTINDALESVSAERSKLGAMQNRLEHTIKNLDNTSENLQASEARIRDVDMAKEMMEQTRQNILAQASTAMLAQANQAPQAVLQLLR